jgi:hypothetical protein
MTSTNQEFERELHELLKKNNNFETAPLRPGELAIITMSRRKTAALFADRAWAVDESGDGSITFGLSSFTELQWRIILLMAKSNKVEDKFQETVGFLFGEIERRLAQEYQQASGVPVIPFYNSTARRDSQYRPGDQTALVCLVGNLGVVDEDMLSWPQVLEFRRDQVGVGWR